MDGRPAARRRARRDVSLLRVPHLLPHHLPVLVARREPWPRGRGRGPGGRCAVRTAKERMADGKGFPNRAVALKPEIVFILGDIFDEGKWSSQKHWEDDVRRFHRMFRHSPDTELVVLVGNHDIGFHYEMDWFKLQRFEKVFNASSTRIVTKKGVNFLLVNSVALHGDGCPICQSVEKELIRLSKDLNCSLQSSGGSSSSTDSCDGAQPYPPSPPIMLQHYPLYRVSDASCTGGVTEAAAVVPARLILSGHTHSGCEVIHENKYVEISVPSFSWRNRNNPSFILASVNSQHHSLSKCFLPEESTVIGVYCSAGACLLLLMLLHCLCLKGLLQCLSLCLLGKHKSL
ncbi:hypothetical protein WMY93_000588 [Mugilogobius chulae]|uniref:Metallophosphoesterase 1 n=1 Tax=Mugilogobius chulae TaxID=88201 RepID=A0AAW0QAG2_9GOBI